MRSAHGDRFQPAPIPNLCASPKSLAAGLLIRIYSQKENSAFALHLGSAVIFIWLTHVVDLSILALPQVWAISPDATRLKDQAELILSYGSTLFLMSTCMLLWRFPEQKLRLADATGIALLCVALVALVKGPGFDRAFLETVDTVTSTGAVIGVGIAFIRFAAKARVEIKGWIAASVYAIWATLQMPFWWAYLNVEQHLAYFYLLTTMTLATTIVTAAFCASALPDRRHSWW